MTTYSLYTTSDGQFTGVTVELFDEADVVANTPSGMAAMEGKFAPDQYVDLATGTVQSGGSPRAPDGFTAVKDVDTGVWHMKPTTSTLATMARTERGRRLTRTDWIALRAYEANGTIPADWRTYRQALRDLPNQTGWPDNITWPAEPSAEP